MRQDYLKQTTIAGLLFCGLSFMSGCASLSQGDEVIAQEEPVTYTAPAQGVVDPNICSPENPAACIVSYEDPSLTLGQSYTPYEGLAVSTNASYLVDMAPVSISVPMIEQGLSVKEKMAQKELEQQQKDLALKPVSNADIICNGEDCQDQLFKTEIEKEVQTTITEETTLRAPTLKDKLAYGEEVHDWEAKAGDTMRTLLRQWGEASGWTVVWKLDRDYHLEAGVVFRGNFTEVAAAFIRSFARATPAPIGTFYKGNRVLVINAQENENAD
ncbi:MAG: toxin co-regulated pilus biosynthesis Q family protein [Alphaproteobacteria bacterium]|nr:toxin co-regulated pilus biosynthesis Q family protein [Alphaproteobacteria bacterium]